MVLKVVVVLAGSFVVAVVSLSRVSVVIVVVLLGLLSWLTLVVTRLVRILVSRVCPGFEVYSLDRKIFAWCVVAAN